MTARLIVWRQDRSGAPSASRLSARVSLVRRERGGVWRRPPRGQRPDDRGGPRANQSRGGRRASISSAAARIRIRRHAPHQQPVSGRSAASRLGSGGAGESRARRPRPTQPADELRLRTRPGREPVRAAAYRTNRRRARVGQGSCGRDTWLLRSSELDGALSSARQRVAPAR